MILKYPSVTDALVIPCHRQGNQSFIQTAPFKTLSSSQYTVLEYDTIPCFQICDVILQIHFTLYQLLLPLHSFPPPLRQRKKYLPHRLQPPPFTLFQPPLPFTLTSAPLPFTLLQSPPFHLQPPLPFTLTSAPLPFTLLQSPPFHLQPPSLSP